MRKLAAIIALAIAACGLGGCSSAMHVAPASSPGAPLGAPPNECVTDEGYGRWHPCGNQS